MTQQAPRVMSVAWNLIRGGTEGQCARAALAACKNGAVHRVAVFRKEGYFLEEVEKQCGPVYHFDIRNFWGVRTGWCCRSFARFLREENIDVVHLWDMDACLFGGRAARLAGIPFITSRRDLGEIYPWYKLRWLQRRENQATKVVVNAVAIWERAVEEGVSPEKIARVPNIIDLSEFDARSEAAYELPASLPPGPRVVMVARLDPEKDVPTLLRAARHIKRDMPMVRFLIAGEGRQRAVIEEMITQMGLGDHVFLLGEVNKVPALLRHADVGVLTPSSNEGFSNSLMEYMAAGLPVIATDCGGNREMVVNKLNGFLVPVGDHIAVANALRNILSDSEMAARFGSGGRSVMERIHQPEIVQARLMEIYEEVARARR